MKIEFTTNAVVEGKAYAIGDIVDSKNLKQSKALLKAGICKKSNPKGVTQ